jgi:hypothetical protein
LIKFYNLIEFAREERGKGEILIEKMLRKSLKKFQSHHKNRKKRKKKKKKSSKKQKLKLTQKKQQKYFKIAKI